MLKAFVHMDTPTRLYGFLWALMGVALIAIALLAATDAIAIDTWDEWSEA